MEGWPVHRGPIAMSGPPAFYADRQNQLQSGLAKFHGDRGFEPRKLRDLHFDVLIALTARGCGARLITSNRADFELIREYRDFERRLGKAGL
jgi:hypothetical protein